MKSTISLLGCVLTLCLMTLNSSCASQQTVLPPPSLENRTLRISADLAGFEYEWNECTRKFLGFCTETTRRKDTYDLSDIEVRKKLIAMGFVAKVREQK